MPGTTYAINGYHGAHSNTTQTSTYLMHINAWCACTPGYVHRGMHTRVCTLGYAHQGMYTGVCTPGYAHRGMYTRVCTPGYVHQGMYTGVLCISRHSPLVTATLISLTFQFECEVVCEVPALVVASQEEQGVLVVQLQAPQVQDTLQ